MKQSNDQVKSLSTPVAPGAATVSRVVWVEADRSRLKSFVMLFATLVVPSTVGAQTNPAPSPDATPPVLAFDEYANPQPESGNSAAKDTTNTATHAATNTMPHPAGTAEPRVSISRARVESDTCKRDWVRDGCYLRLLTITGYTSFRGNGPNGSANIAGIGAGSIIALGGSLARGLVLAGTLQSVQMTGKFHGGPYPDVTFVSNDETVKFTQKAMASSSTIGALLDWYPFVKAGLHVGIGAGIGLVSMIHQADDSVQYGTGFSATLLSGYDWSISPNWALGLALVASGSSKVKMKHEKSGNDSGYDFTPASLGISASLLYF